MQAKWLRNLRCEAAKNIASFNVVTDYRSQYQLLLYENIVSA